MTDKVPAHVIIQRLTKEKQKRLQDHRKKGMKYSPRSKRLRGINVYMTTTSTDIVQYMIGTLYIGKSRFHLKYGNYSFILPIVKR